MTEPAPSSAFSRSASTIGCEDDRRPLRRCRRPRQARSRRGEDRLPRGAARISTLGTAQSGSLAEPGYERWDGRGAVGYLTLAALCDAQLADPPSGRAARRRLAVLPDRGARLLGQAARRGRARGRADCDLAAPARAPGRRSAADGHEPARDRDPELATGGRSSTDVSMGRVTHGDVLLGGAADPADLVPFGGEQAHKAFAFALGLQLLVERSSGRSPGAALLVAGPEADPVPALRELAPGAASPRGQLTRRRGGGARRPRPDRPARLRGRAPRGSRSRPTASRSAPRSPEAKPSPASCSASSAASASSTSSHSSSGVSPKSSSWRPKMRRSSATGVG